MAKVQKKEYYQYKTQKQFSEIRKSHSDKYAKAILENTPPRITKERKRLIRQVTVCQKQRIDCDTGEIKTWYCGLRTCPNCNRIRSYYAMMKYEKKIESLKDKRFVTLTTTTTPYHQTKKRLKNMYEAFKRIKALAKNNKIPFHGIRKLEINHAKSKTGKHHYHPHFHILIESETSANFLVEKWIKIINKLEVKEVASIKAQDITIPDEKVQKELFKYVLKPIKNVGKDSEGNRVSINRLGKEIPITELQELTIHKLMSGRRQYQPFGKVTPRRKTKIVSISKLKKI